MKYLDRSTLSLVMVMASAVSALVMFAIWRINRLIPGVRWWVGATVLGTVGFALLMVAKPYLSNPGVSMLLSNMLLFSALLMILEGTLRFTDHPSTLRWRAGLLLIPVFMVLTWYYQNDPLTRRVFHDGTYALLLAVCAAMMMRGPNPEDRLVNALSAFFLLGIACVMGMRALVATQLDSESALDAHPINSVVFLVIVMFVMGWTYSVHMACYLRAQRTIRELEREDALTGLSSRNHLAEVVGQEIARSQRTGIRFSYLLIDVDDLRQLHQEQGHSASDEVLRALGERLREFARDADFACHLGNDQFAVLLHHTPTLEHLRGAISRLRQLLAAPIRLEDRSTQLDFSIGMAMWPVDGETQAALEETALQRMEAEKFSMFRPSLNQPGVSP